MKNVTVPTCTDQMTYMSLLYLTCTPSRRCHVEATREGSDDMDVHLSPWHVSPSLPSLFLLLYLFLLLLCLLLYLLLLLLLFLSLSLSHDN